MEPTNQGEASQEVSKLSQVIQIDEGKVQVHLGEVVRSTVEETLNAMLDAEADRLCHAEHYNQIDASANVRKTLDSTITNVYPRSPVCEMSRANSSLLAQVFRQGATAFNAWEHSGVGRKSFS